jgi:hypothetical protein
MNTPSDRRQFLSMGAAAIPAILASGTYAAPTPQSSAETAVKGLFESLTIEQKKEL